MKDMLQLSRDIKERGLQPPIHQRQGHLKVTLALCSELKFWKDAQARRTMWTNNKAQQK